MAGDDGVDVDIDHRDLRNALEYAVAMAGELARRKPPIDTPAELKKHVNADRLPSAALGRVRRAVVADDTFRTRIAVGAIPELVDPIGRLWLQRPDGWEAAITRELATREEARESDDARNALKKSEKRRLAAEQATLRARGEVVGLRAAADQARDDADELGARLETLEGEVAELRADLAAARLDARHARDRERAANDRLAARMAERERSTATRSGDSEPGEQAGTDPNGNAADGRDTGASGEAARLEEQRVALEELRRTVGGAARAADRLADDLAAAAGLARDGGEGRPAENAEPARESPPRVPLRLPGGVSATSEEAASFLLRSGAVVLVDGYNVAMLAWPRLDLCDQRDALIAALENLARRFGSSVTIVFDGATVVGSHAGTRRLVRVTYSPEGVTADDVIREQVSRTANSTPVVVVTNDAEIVRDVRAAGANVISSTTFAALL